MTPHRSLARARWPLIALVALAVWSLAAAINVGSIPSYKSVDPVALSGHLADVLTTPQAAAPEYWQNKPTLAETYAFPLHPIATAADVEAVARMERGEFRPDALFPWTKLGVPPPWDVNPANNATWDFYRHALEWVRPLLNVGVANGNRESLLLAERVMEDWIKRNSAPPGPTDQTWNDSAAAKRVRVFCWFWEATRRSGKLPPDFERLLLASVYQHALYLADPRNYPKRSNHGLEMDGALLAAAITFPEFADASRWRQVAEDRVGAFIKDDFSPAGFHLEQSPGYHYYVLTRLSAITRFLTANHQAVPEALAQGSRRAASVMPYLVQPNGKYPAVGDTEGGPPSNWRSVLAAGLGREALVPAASTAPNPRQDGASFLLDFDSGYAVSTSYPVAQQSRKSDTYALFKCNSFNFGHSHYDALSFTLYGLGRDWIVDSGKLNYEEKTPERQYMRSSRAHNVVLVDSADYRYPAMELVDYGRSSGGDYVTVRQALPQAHHTRTFEFMPPTTARITDVLESADDKPHTYAQLFHVAPGLRVKQLGAGRQVIIAPDGSSCAIDELSPGDDQKGEWKVITGQKEPFIQGWYSPEFNKIEPNPVLYYAYDRPSMRAEFVTCLSLRAKQTAPRAGQARR